jgi:hypothetical protein
MAVSTEKKPFINEIICYGCNNKFEPLGMFMTAVLISYTGSNVMAASDCAVGSLFESSQQASPARFLSMLNQFRPPNQRWNMFCGCITLQGASERSCRFSISQALKLSVSPFSSVRVEVKLQGLLRMSTVV